MKISGVDIRPGNIIEYENGIWKVAKIQHTQPGKGGAYMQVEMKNLQDGRKTNVRFRSADTVEKVRLDTKEYQFLYEDGDMLVFMDAATYDQINLPSDLLGDARPFLQDGMQVMLELWEEKPISVQLPAQIEAEIVEAAKTINEDLQSLVMFSMCPTHHLIDERNQAEIYLKEFPEFNLLESYTSDRKIYRDTAYLGKGVIEVNND